MQVTPRLHMLRLPFTIRAGDEIVLERFVNTCIIAGRSITLVDAGVAGSEERIFSYLRTIGRDPSEIGLLILTHSHPDHIGAAHALRQATGCRIAAHAAERAWIEDVNLQCASRPVPGFHSLVGGPVPVDTLLEDGDVLDLTGDHRLDTVVFHVPGHSPGSIALLVRDEGALITGDAVPVPGDIPVYDDLLASVRSLRRLLGIGDVRLLLSSWDEPQHGICTYQRMRDSLGYLQTIHTAVLRTMRRDPPPDLKELCRLIATDLNLPPAAITPMLVRTLEAHLLLCDRPRLIIDDEPDAPPGGSVLPNRERPLLG